MRAVALLRLLLPAALVAAAVVLLRAGASGTVAPEIDVTGRWNLELTGPFTTACETQFTQNGTGLTADWLCEPGLEFTGTIKEDDSGVEFEITGTVLSVLVTAEGTVSQDGNSASGTWSGGGFDGEFTAERKLDATVTPTPSSTPAAPPATSTPPSATATATKPATVAPTPAHTPTPAPVTPHFGDVNCDGTINSIDATLVLQYGAGLIDTLPCLVNADVNQDGVVNSLDAAIILQYVAGFLTDLPA